ncbi:MAG: Asp-tRNA(Asn)/Glu-tRNA(Gln) amidotransferase subunit GatA [Clostridia bacterium]|nr:Asp-tRNA(Asn)/Glu-tRNA(Gln) amidotransferase subunit GatA [Clostridia bacterium]
MNLHLKSIKELRGLLDGADLTAQELTQYYLDRIQKLDPIIHAYITVNEKAMEQAEAAQKMIEAGAAGPLTGIVLGLKDNICTKGLRTTCASKMLEDFIPAYDATVAEKLEEAGAIFIGKLNMDEFAMGASTETSFFGATRNPYDPERVPGGSSGGSAAAVAAGLCVAALGSDTGGSIRQPAAFCGVTGIKPTYGRVSRYGLVAFASSLDQIGPIAKSARDCAYLLDAISGQDPKDMTSRPSEAVVPMLGESVEGTVIGVPKECFGEGLDPEVRAAVEKAIEKYEEMGCVIREVFMPSLKYAVPAYYLISSAEASSNLARYDGVRYGYRSKEGKNFEEQVIATRNEGFGNEVKRRILLGTYALSGAQFDAYYKKADLLRRRIKKEYEEIFRICDCMITPTAPEAAFKFGEKGGDPTELYLADLYTAAVNIAGLPAVSTTCGYTKEWLPIGMSIVGKPFAEGEILNLADAFEKKFNYILNDFCL